MNFCHDFDSAGRSRTSNSIWRRWWPRTSWTKRSLSTTFRSTKHLQSDNWCLLTHTAHAQLVWGSQMQFKLAVVWNPNNVWRFGVQLSYLMPTTSRKEKRAKSEPESDAVVHRGPHGALQRAQRNSVAVQEPLEPLARNAQHAHGQVCCRTFCTYTLHSALSSVRW